MIFCGDRLRNFYEDLFFGEHLHLCPWSLALASSIPVLGLESVCPRKGCPWPWPRIFFVSLALSLVSSTPPLLVETSLFNYAGLDFCANLSTSLIFLRHADESAKCKLQMQTRRIRRV